MAVRRPIMETNKEPNTRRWRQAFSSITTMKGAPSRAPRATPGWGSLAIRCQRIRACFCRGASDNPGRGQFQGGFDAVGTGETPRSTYKGRSRREIGGASVSAVINAFYQATAQL